MNEMSLFEAAVCKPFSSEINCKQVLRIQFIFLIWSWVSKDKKSEKYLKTSWLSRYKSKKKGGGGIVQCYYETETQEEERECEGSKV